MKIVYESTGAAYLARFQIGTLLSDRTMLSGGGATKREALRELKGMVRVLQGTVNLAAQHAALLVERDGKCDLGMAHYLWIEAREGAWLARCSEFGSNGTGAFSALVAAERAGAWLNRLVTLMDETITKEKFVVGL
jgi:hypothetical protein